MEPDSYVVEADEAGYILEVQKAVEYLPRFVVLVHQTLVVDHSLVVAFLVAFVDAYLDSFLDLVVDILVAFVDYYQHEAQIVFPVEQFVPEPHQLEFMYLLKHLLLLELS